MAMSSQQRDAGQRLPGRHVTDRDPLLSMHRPSLRPTQKKSESPRLPWQLKQAQKSEAISVQPRIWPPAPGICRVLIAGVPRKLMDSAIVEAMLQQAGMENGFSEFFLRLEGRSGAIFVDCLGQSQAKRCVAHFNGCCWDPSGKAVTAQVVRADMGARKPVAQFRCRPVRKCDEPVKIVSSLELPPAFGSASPTWANFAAQQVVQSGAKTGSVASTTEGGCELEEE